MSLSPESPKHSEFVFNPANLKMTEKELEERRNYQLRYDPGRTYTSRELSDIDCETLYERIEFKLRHDQAATVQNNHPVSLPSTIQNNQSISSPSTIVEGSKKRGRCDSNVGDSELTSDDPPTLFPPSPKRTRMDSPLKNLQVKAPDSRDSAVSPATHPVRSIPAAVTQPSTTVDTALDAQLQPSTPSENKVSLQAAPAQEIKPLKNNAPKGKAIAYLKTIPFINQAIFGNPKSIPEIKIHCVKCDQLVWMGVKPKVEGEDKGKVVEKKGKRKQKDGKAKGVGEPEVKAETKERERRVNIYKWTQHMTSCVDKNNKIVAELKADDAVDKAGLGDELTPIADIRIRCVHCETLVWEGKKEVKGSEEIQGVKGDTEVDVSKWKAHRASCHILLSHEQPEAPSAEEATVENSEA